MHGWPNPGYFSSILNERGLARLAARTVGEACLNRRLPMAGSVRADVLAGDRRGLGFQRD